MLGWAGCRCTFSIASLVVSCLPAEANETMDSGRLLGKALPYVQTAVIIGGNRAA